MLSKKEKAHIVRVVSNLLKQIDPKVDDPVKQADLSRAHRKLYDVLSGALTSDDREQIASLQSVVTTAPVPPTATATAPELPPESRRPLLSAGVASPIAPGGQTAFAIAQQVARYYASPEFLLTTLPKPSRWNASSRLDKIKEASLLIRTLVAQKLEKLRMTEGNPNIVDLDANQIQFAEATSLEQYGVFVKSRLSSAQGRKRAAAVVLSLLSAGALASGISAFFCEDNRCDTTLVTEWFSHLVDSVADHLGDPTTRIATVATSATTLVGSLAYNAYSHFARSPEEKTVEAVKAYKRGL